MLFHWAPTRIAHNLYKICKAAIDDDRSQIIITAIAFCF